MFTIRDQGTRLVFAVLMTGLTGCQPVSCPGDFLGQDQLSLLDTIDMSGTNYHLYARQTGFQEKLVFLELYDRGPVFDECEHANVDPVYNVVYNDYPIKQHIKTITLEPDADELLVVVYTQDINEGFPDVYMVKFDR